MRFIARFLQLLVLSLALPLPALGQDDFNVPLLTLDQAIEMALSANLNYLNLLDRTELAQLDYASARSIYKTKFRFSTSSDARSGAEIGSFSNFVASKQYETGAAISTGLYNSTFGDRTLSEFRLSYTLPFFQNPLSSAELKLDQAEVSFSKRKRLQEIGTRELVNRVISSYTELIKLEHMLRLAIGEYEISQNNLHAFQIRAAGGEVSEIDLSLVELQKDRAEQQLERARFNKRTMQTALKNLLGIDLDLPVEFDSEFPENRHEELFALSLPELETHAGLMRIELIGKREDLAIAQKKMSATTGSRFPPMEVSLQYAYVDESGSPLGRQTFDEHRFGLGFRMDSDFGFSAKARERRRHVLQYRTQEREYEQLQMDIKMEVQRAYFNSIRSRDTLEFSARSAQIGALYFDQMRIQFDNGQLDTLGLLEAEKRLQKSRYDELSGRINYLQAGQALAMAIGKYE